MRGKDIAVLCPRRVYGITPAHAGKSQKMTKKDAPERDHPRPCGEKTVTLDPAPPACGSPPPMRGKASDTQSPNRSARITPAHAGKRFCRIRARMSALDHPRPCGEKHLSGYIWRHQNGSPPPMRGKARRIAANARAVRITPAHAGKSIWRSSSDDDLIGSPPPMRGKAYPDTAWRWRPGITPAHAGKRSDRRGHW